MIIIHLHSRQCEKKIHPVQESIQGYDNVVSRVGIYVGSYTYTRAIIIV